MVKQFARQPVLRKLFYRVWGPLDWKRKLQNKYCGEEWKLCLNEVGAEFV
jgi:hypothetical protein